MTCLKLTVILAAELAAALPLASIVSRDKKAYSRKLVHGAKTLFKFSRDQLGRYNKVPEGEDTAISSQKQFF